MVLVGPCILRSSAVMCEPKVRVCLNHLGVIGTQTYVGQRINKLTDYAEYSMTDSNRQRKIILRIPAAVGILISSRCSSLLPF